MVVVSFAAGLPEPPPLTEAQEEEITENLVNIQKMQKNQVKCRKVRRGQGPLVGWGLGGLCRPPPLGWSQKAWTYISALLLSAV